MNLYSIISKFPSSYLFSLVFCSDFLHYQWEKNKLRSEFVPVLKKIMILAKGMCVTAPYIKGHRLRKKIRNYEYENDRQRH